jgi:hypothetical protein
MWLRGLAAAYTDHVVHRGGMTQPGRICLRRRTSFHRYVRKTRSQQLGPPTFAPSNIQASQHLSFVTGLGHRASASNTPLAEPSSQTRLARTTRTIECSVNPFGPSQNADEREGRPASNIAKSIDTLGRAPTSLEQAASEIRSIVPPHRENDRLPIELVSAHAEIGRLVRRVLVIFQLGVVLILLIASVNVVNLLLARAAHCERELAIRVALGAGVLRLVRQSVIESLLLAGIGGSVGSLLAYGLTNAMRMLPPHVLPRLHEIRVDGTVLMFALTVTVATGLVVGLVSGLRIIRRHPSSQFTQQALRGISPSSQRRLRPSGVRRATARRAAPADAYGRRQGPVGRRRAGGRDHQLHRRRLSRRARRQLESDRALQARRGRPHRVDRDHR